VRRVAKLIGRWSFRIAILLSLLAGIVCVRVIFVREPIRVGPWTIQFEEPNSLLAQWTRYYTDDPKINTSEWNAWCVGVEVLTAADGRWLLFTIFVNIALVMLGSATMTGIGIMLLSRRVLWRAPIEIPRARAKAIKRHYRRLPREERAVLNRQIRRALRFKMWIIQVPLYIYCAFTFVYLIGGMMGVQHAERGYGVVILTLFPLAILTFAIYFDFVRWAARQYLAKTLPALCERCGYDLTGNTSGRCPECGVAIQKS